MAKLDLQPVNKKLDLQPIGSSLDLQPVGSGLDLQPVGQQQELKPIIDPQSPEGKTVSQFGLNLANTLGFGIPEFVTKKFGYEIPEPETSAEKISAGLGELGGFIGGPLKIGGKVAVKVLPKILSNPTQLKTLGLLMGRNAISMGVASGLMTPEEGLFIDPVQRAKQFGSGAVQGIVYGGLSFIPSTPMRVGINAAAFGVPATLQHEPLEVQIFNYGLGAWFGRKGLSLKNEFQKQQELTKLVKDGFEGNDFLNKNEPILNNFKTEVESRGKTPFSIKDKLVQFENINKNSVFNYDKNGYSTLKKDMPELYKYEYRPDLENRVWEQINFYKKTSSKNFRFDDVDYILNNIGKTKEMYRKEVKKLTDKQLGGIEEILFNPPKMEMGLKDIQPETPQMLNFWDRVFRPGYILLKKMGLGNLSGNGLVNEIFTNDSEMSNFMSRHYQLIDNWKRTVGVRKETAENIAMFLDGQITDKILIESNGKKSLDVANQIRSYLDTILVAVNRQRAKYNQPKIEKVENYLTHIFGELGKDKGKGVLPSNIESALDYITPKKKFNPYEFKRKTKRKDFSLDLWNILDTYAMKESRVINDDFIRKTHRYINFLKTKRDLGEAYGFNVNKQIKNIENFINVNSGRRLPIDESISVQLEPWNKWMQNLGFENLQIKDVSSLSHALTSMIYGTQMAYRPKLAIRNLGQHMLIIGQTGFKPLLKALGTKRTPEIVDILSKSKVIRSRARAFAPESDVLGKFMKSGMWMFQKADMKNVTDAFLAGYYEAGGGKKGIARGDEVAALTQFLYLSGNRNGLSSALGQSRIIGRSLSMFTTWPTNYVEFIMASSAPEHRNNLIKYLATSTGFIALSALLGIKGVQYTGLNSPLSLYQWFTEGRLPISGVLERPRFGIYSDIKKVLDDDDLKQLIFYTVKEEE